MSIVKLIKLECHINDVRGVVVWSEGLGALNPLCITNEGDAEHVVVTFRHIRSVEDLSEVLIHYLEHTFKLSYV